MNRTETFTEVTPAQRRVDWLEGRKDYNKPSSLREDNFTFWIDGNPIEVFILVIFLTIFTSCQKETFQRDHLEVTLTIRAQGPIGLTYDHRQVPDEIYDANYSFSNYDYNLINTTTGTLDGVDEVIYSFSYPVGDLYEFHMDAFNAEVEMTVGGQRFGEVKEFCGVMNLKFLVE